MSELLTFFVILIAGLFFSELFKRLHLPYVTALIVAGVVVGPFAFDLVEVNATLEFIGSIGVVFLMFIAGSEIKTRSFDGIRNKVISIASLNGLIPFVVGFGIGHLMGFNSFTSLILGTIFISSSVGVIVPSLEALGLTGTTLGRSIIASTVIEDVASLLLLAFVLQSAKPITQIPLWFYIPLLLLVIYILKSIMPKLEKVYHKGKKGKDLFESELRFVFVVLIATVILFELLGMHAIIAGFITGMILSESIKGKLSEKIRTMSYGLFIPFFFLILGIKTDISVFAMTDSLVLIGVIVVGLVAAKLVGGYLGARISKFSSRSSWVVGFATLPQLSTSLAAAFAALEFGLLDGQVISAIVVLSILTTLLTPVFLRMMCKRCRPTDKV